MKTNSPLNERASFIIPGDRLAASLFCVEYFVALANFYIEKKKRFSVALAGGSTPQQIYQTLVKKPYRDKLDWKKVWLFWSDERAVVATHSESNYYRAMEAGFKNLVSPENIFRMKAEENIAENAKHYETQIKKHLKGDLFDLVMLGVGKDGHVASLFADTKALKEKKKYVVENFIPQKKVWRMTLTLNCINKSSNILICVFGENKKEIMKKILTEKNSLPAQNIGTKKNKALWVLDNAAFEGIKDLFL